MDALLRSLSAMAEIQDAAARLGRGESPLSLTGLSPVHRALCSAALAREGDRPLLAICADEKECTRLGADLTALTGWDAVVLPQRDWHVGAAAAESHQWEHRRLLALHRMAEGTARAVITTVVGAAQFCMGRDDLMAHTLTLRTAESYDITDLSRRLVDMGYTRYDQVEGPGQFALRGGILDVFSPGMELPVRCDFFDDELDGMGVFDPVTQRRTENVDTALLLPAAEVIGPARPTVWDYLSPHTLVTIHDSSRCGEALRQAFQEAKADRKVRKAQGEAVEGGPLGLDETELGRAIAGFAAVALDNFLTSRPLVPPQALLQLNCKQLSTYGGSLDTACLDITHYLTMGYGVLVLCGGEVRARNMLRLLEDRGVTAALDLQGAALPERNQVRISLGALSAGSEFPSLRLAVLTEGQLTERVAGKAGRVRQKRDDSRRKLQSYTDLSPGDLVVHAHHGIGRFTGIIRMPVDGVEKDYMKIAYAGSDCLYVPCTALDLVSKYIGGGSGEEGEKPVHLNKLGGTEWAKTTYRAKAAARELAKELIRLYAQRQRLGGFAFSPDSPWQKEFEDAFGYPETGDQLKAIREIKADMEKPVPMDRLLCGDVGYGKTEVALRAAMKCIMDGKQAAILVPTTVLAQQHYATAMSRFQGFPVNIEVLSRFCSPKQAREIMERAKQGRIDLLIGTHKLLQKNLAFKDLGLLIIDEEQRFGVKHKETLRQRQQQVDTLTLSATPIPRTMHMALSGIRDMSSIEEPPHDRLPVQTYVLEHDWGVVAEAIRTELDRHGQVYYLHNRVESIDSAAFKLQQLLGEDTVIATAHGKMSESQLSDVMQRMADGDIDVLVCTTIIETGIDIPNVNTLIIEDADRMGLSQLHQIRGRIGRSPRRAYAYLTYRPGKVLTEVAAKRLTAIREYVEFGSGFRIAMRDLEIRGAGNLLGPEQSGYMMTVGYDMYLKLLNDAVLEQQGKSAQIRPECSADLSISAHIPEKYVSSAEQRMDLYRRIAAIRTAEDSADVLDEIIDRYGEPPATVQALLDVALLRAAAAEVGIADITQKGREVTFTFSEHADGQALVRLCAMPRYRRTARLAATEKARLTYYLPPEEKVLSAAGRIVEDLTLLQPKQPGPLPEKEDDSLATHP